MSKIKKNIPKRKEKSKNWRGHGKISGRQFSRLKQKAREREIDFNLSIEYLWNLFLKQNGRCAISGVKLTFGKYWKDNGNASLDRIYSNRSYREGNVQWVHKHVNFMKQSMRPMDFILWCRRVVRFSDKKKS